MAELMQQNGRVDASGVKEIWWHKKHSEEI
jgi:hypothetical protein